MLEIDETFKLTEETMKLATLAGLDFKEATSQMTSALRGFKLEMDEGQRVTDVYSELAAKAAADVQGIAYAMSKTSSIAYSAGMSFENTAAFLTQMIETTQEAPSVKILNG
jgi:TP901 family phage tail tape measure protein